MNDKMKILGRGVDRRSDYLDIHDLKFLADNPRVYACTHGQVNFANKTAGEQQQIIYKELLKESSVKNLIPEIKRHGGLMESILVRWDTMEVIEGNSRLAVYRKLHEIDGKGDWELIPCEIVSKNRDTERSHFSFYKVLADNREAKSRIEESGLKRLLSDIKQFGENHEENDFTALNMRKMLPVVLNKPKVLKKYESGEISLDEAYQRAKTSRAEDKVKQATALLNDVERSEIETLASNGFNAFKLAFKKHRREVKRIDGMIGN